MGILDEAIKEHLELKRQHGAEASELKKLEDEAFGPADRPVAQEAVSEQFAEAPTEFMSQPDIPPAATHAPAVDAPEAEAAEQEDVGGSAPARPRRSASSEIADLQEAPPFPEPAEEPPAMEHAAISPAPTAPEDAGPAEPSEVQPETTESELEASAPETADPAPTETAEPEAGEMAEPEMAEAAAGAAPEPEASSTEPPSSTGPSTEERQAIADQPTEHYDIEQELAASEAGPSEDQLVEEELNEPRLAPADPLAGLEAIEEGEESPSAMGSEAAQTEAPEDEDDFFDEKRLSDELDQALEAPSKGDEQDDEPPAGEGGWHTDEHEALGKSGRSSRKGEDLLDETPDFLEEAPEDDQLWFEQKPPKDFDFDD